MRKLILLIVFSYVLAFSCSSQSKTVRYVCVEEYGKKPMSSLDLIYNPKQDSFKKLIQNDDEIALETSKRSKEGNKHLYKLEMKMKDIKHAYNTLYITIEGDSIKAKLDDDEHSEVKLIFKKKQ